jgi:dCMP deaminase
MANYHHRPSWDLWALGIAQAIAARADCRRRRVGCVILGPKHNIVSIGYNGVAPGRQGCLDGHCPRGLATYEDVPLGSDYGPGQAGYCIATHAEMNALIRADHESLYEATMYVTSLICDPCAKVISNTPMHRLVWTEHEAIKWRLI